MNIITKDFVTAAMTSFLSKLTTKGYTLYAYDDMEDEDLTFETNGELANELLWTMDMSHLIIENEAGKHTVVQIIPENLEDMIGDWAPYHCHNDKFVEQTIEDFGDYLETNLR